LSVVAVNGNAFQWECIHDSTCGAIVEAYINCFAGNWMDTDDNADVVNVLVTTGQLVPTLGKLLLFKLDGAFQSNM